MLSVAVSILGSVLLTRFLLYLIADEKRLRHALFFTPNRAVSSSGFDFVKHGGKFLAASLLIAAVGGVSLVRGNTHTAPAGFCHRPGLYDAATFSSCDYRWSRGATATGAAYNASVLQLTTRQRLRSEQA